MNKKTLILYFIFLVLYPINILARKHWVPMDSIILSDPYIFADEKTKTYGQLKYTNIKENIIILLLLRTQL